MARNRHRPFVYTQPDHYQRVYTSERGRTAHLLHLNHPPGSGMPAACDRRPRDAWQGWYGTGSQAEYERAAELPLCKECRMAVYGE